jgi:16S rRNA (adenine1518-N6/adenine1519-N6)-dimethyltransferase
MEKHKFKKQFGQNFLIDNNIIRRIVESADVDKETLVIEIGPGEGAISNGLIPLSGHSILYEIDNSLEEKLNFLFKDYNNKSIIIDDFLKRNIKEDIKNYKFDKLYVVANLPYYITTPIIMKFIEEDVLPDKFVVMVQKEVAHRLSANVGSRDYGSLTVFLNYYYDIDILFNVSKNCFIPKPNVESAVISMKKKENKLEIKDISLFKKIVRDSFLHKRKTLRNNLRGYNLDIIEKVLNKYGFDLNVRAENLKLDVFVEMANELFFNSK